MNAHPWVKTYALIKAKKLADNTNMNRDDFIFALKEQFADEIHEAYIECNHEDAVDLESLAELLADIWKSAKAQGLSYADFDDVVKATLPADCDSIEWGPRNTAA